MKYRNDIDGLRAIAVLAVIFFHLGFLQNGYLGVDVFFVISGYLITSIIYKEVLENRFSIFTFYERRIRRIIPLLLFITLVAFVLGLLFMLPDDLENLSQSVIASNLSANNILMFITSKDYWNTLNEYKPLMHTWSLGIEEQFYFIFPALILIVSKFSKNYIKLLLIFISLFSLLLFLFSENEASRFYLLQYRFFELSTGGLAAVITFDSKKISNSFRFLLYFTLITLVGLMLSPIQSSKILVLLTTLLSVLLISLGKFFYIKDKVSNYILQNKIIVFIGKISFSLYMWHQLIFAFTRYVLLEKINFLQGLLLIIITFILSLFTYYVIENPFRDRKRFATKKVIIILGIVFFISTTSSLYVYLKGGVIKDFPSLGLYKADAQKQSKLFSSNDNIHIHYNELIRNLDKPFELQNNNHKMKVLVLGNSFGRDVANIFLESTIRDDIELTYFDIDRVKNDHSLKQRAEDANLIVIGVVKFISKQQIVALGLDLNKVMVFGTKDFGYSNGINYNRMRAISDYSSYYVSMRAGTLAIEQEYEKEWGNQYISLIKPLLNSSGKIRVFTEDGKFISQDTEHLTKFGAQFYAKRLNNDLVSILKKHAPH
ncbi:MAG TPA: acyltransferase [Edaphocola sp.]|nr:acyltransferase [Edaphocola sp.]